MLLLLIVVATATPVVVVGPATTTTTALPATLLRHVTKGISINSAISPADIIPPLAHILLILSIPIHGPTGLLLIGPSQPHVLFQLQIGLQSNLLKVLLRLLGFLV